MTPHTEFYLSFGVEEDIDREYYLDAFYFSKAASTHSITWVTLLG